MEHCERQKSEEKSITVAVDGGAADPADVPRDPAIPPLVQSICASAGSIQLFKLLPGSAVSWSSCSRWGSWVAYSPAGHLPEKMRAAMATQR